jgi:hypothetical protein
MTQRTDLIFFSLSIVVGFVDAVAKIGDPEYSFDHDVE